MVRDSVAGAVGRFAAGVGSAVNWFRQGYHRRKGPFDFRFHEADMPGGGPSARWSLACYWLGDRLALNLRNDSSPLDFSRQIQSINVSFQVRI